MTDLPPSDDELHLSVQPIEIQHEMEQSFLDYAMSVITARALPEWGSEINYHTG